MTISRKFTIYIEKIAVLCDKMANFQHGSMRILWNRTQCLKIEPVQDHGTHYKFIDLQIDTGHIGDVGISAVRITGNHLDR